MTLPKLAALAERVPGFERPTRMCSACGARDYMRLGLECDEMGFNRLCRNCSGRGTVANDDPAALLMAVMLYARKHHGDVEMNGASVAVHAMRIGPAMRRGRAAIPEETKESIARAALVALLRAHGVEVADE